MVEEQADALVLFGITGDLAEKLIPALYELTSEGRLRHARRRHCPQPVDRRATRRSRP